MGEKSLENEQKLMWMHVIILNTIKGYHRPPNGCIEHEYNEQTSTY